MAGGGALARQPLGEFSVDVVEAARAQEEALDLLRLPLEHLLREIGEDVAAQARVAERVLERLGVEPRERHAGEHHARRPPFGERQQAAHVFRIVVLPRALAQHLRDLSGVEQQQVARDARHLPSQSELLQAEGRLVSGQDHEVEPSGQFSSR